MEMGHLRLARLLATTIVKGQAIMPTTTGRVRKGSQVTPLSSSSTRTRTAARRRAPRHSNRNLRSSSRTNSKRAATLRNLCRPQARLAAIRHPHSSLTIVATTMVRPTLQQKHRQMCATTSPLEPRTTRLRKSGKQVRKTAVQLP